MTDQTRFKLLAVLASMRQKISMDSFDDRLALQKKTYLLQELGLNLGNSYGWYIRGPYSRDVANDGFHLASVQNHVDKLETLSKSDRINVARYEKLISEAKTEFNKDETYCLELLASLHFVLKYGYPRSPKGKRAPLTAFSVLKPQFSEDAKAALALLEKHGLA